MKKFHNARLFCLLCFSANKKAVLSEGFFVLPAVDWAAFRFAMKKKSRFQLLLPAPAPLKLAGTAPGFAPESPFRACSSLHHLYCLFCHASRTFATIFFSRAYKSLVPFSLCKYPLWVCGKSPLCAGGLKSICRTRFPLT